MPRMKHSSTALAISPAPGRWPDNSATPGSAGVCGLAANKTAPCWSNRRGDAVERCRRFCVCRSVDRRAFGAGSKGPHRASFPRRRFPERRRISSALRTGRRASAAATNRRELATAFWQSRRVGQFMVMNQRPAGGSSYVKELYKKRIAKMISVWLKVSEAKRFRGVTSRRIAEKPGRRRPLPAALRRRPCCAGRRLPPERQQAHDAHSVSSAGSAAARADLIRPA